MEKDPTLNPQNIVVLFDSQPIQYTVESLDQAWVLHFTYTHSKHDILVDLTGEFAETATVNAPISFVILAIVLTAALISVGLAVYFKKRRH